jgi:glycosyltransferase involved in cell wall biosynthesis
MRACVVTETYPPELNGVALTMERSLRYLRGCGHAAELIRPRQPGEAARRDDLEWRTFGMPIPQYPELRFGIALQRSLRERFARTRPQVVHIATQGPLLGRAALLAANALRLPVTTDFRTNFHWYSRYYRLGWAEPLLLRYLRDFHSRADCTFVPTREMHDTLRAQGFPRLEVLGRGVDAALFSPARRSAELRAAWGATSPTQPVLLYVGRVAAEKNVELALRAFVAGRRLRPEMRMIVVGDGPQRQLLQHRFPEAQFVGVQHGEALAQHYASADLFLFPSLSETFGNVTLEAMASGLAVVAFATAAAAEHVRDGENGVLASPDDPASFVAATSRALALEEGRWQLRVQARMQALGADWATLLYRFERRLADFALRTPARAPGHVVLA